MDYDKGSVKEFDQNWLKRKETAYSHWTRGKPENQIQLAFRNHWITFNELLDGRVGDKKCLEIGCGRGSLSAYFADDGWDCTLLDISSTVIDQAKVAFDAAELKANFLVADCNKMPIEDNSYDLIFSIGLLEHFADSKNVISEQIRILKPGGLFIAYVVPELKTNIQKDFNWVNDLLEVIYEDKIYQKNEKSEIFRSDALSAGYLEILEDLNLNEINSFGSYPLPMISYSPSFPFTLLPKKVEKKLTEIFSKWLERRKNETGENPWKCDEEYGQAFVISGRK